MGDNKKDITDIIQKVHDDENKPSDNEDNIDTLKALELAKIVVQEVLKLKNIESLTFISPEQIDDIVQAKLLNSFYDVPEIDQYILNFETLKRSENGQLVNLISRLAMFNNNDENNQNRGIFDRFLRR